MHRFWIALGSNIDAERNLRAAAALLRSRFADIRFSGLYRSPPAEVETQPEFRNACAAFASDENPMDVLAALQGIERVLKKAPPYRFGPRTIDLDMLLVDDEVFPGREEWLAARELPVEGQTSALYLPHLRMDRRRFVLLPLSELIDGNARHPALSATWAELLQATAGQECERVDGTL